MFVVAEEEEAVTIVFGRDMVTDPGGKDAAAVEVSGDRAVLYESDGLIA